MEYEQLELSYREDTLAAAMYARELEYFHYDFDRKNFEKLLEAFPEGEYRSNIEARLASTIEQMANVERIYVALKSQIIDQAAYEAAVVRVKKKREALEK